VVVVAYADWECARAPALDEVVEFAWARPGAILLVDTYCKEPGQVHRDRRPTLLDWLPLERILEIGHQCRGAGVRLALAGSLGPDQIAQLRPVRPDWFAVRGAACTGGLRAASVDVAKVRALVSLVGGGWR
jgi:hypothetical protein